MEQPRNSIFLPEDVSLESVSGPNSTFFTGQDDLVNLNFDPIVVGGSSFIYWVKLPAWFDKDPVLKYYKALSEKNFRSFQGLSDMSLESAQAMTSFAGNSYDVVTKISKENTDFTIGHKEYSGSIMRKMYERWISYIRDPRTGTATYPKTFGVDYGARNHTGQLMYISTRPDATNVDKNIVEFAAFYTNVFPTQIPIGIYNYDMGSQDSPTLDINFKGFMETGPDVERYAQRLLKEKIIANEANKDGLVFVDSMRTDSFVNDLMKDSNDSFFKNTKVE